MIEEVIHLCYACSYDVHVLMSLLPRYSTLGYEQPVYNYRYLVPTCISRVLSGRIEGIYGYLFVSYVPRIPNMICISQKADFQVVGSNAKPRTINRFCYKCKIRP